ncbi:hypothetical protein BDP27DRAFT_1453752 [Rhodocollybia butyracea]|uniref:Uncharacterized protein n=1 Tax=Rhodocollybia butyracea TaxID=206335 RepID=A0A9P5P7Q4_9AGAR|nr:hypothetical protein BDP27DRAFT_1453752 [Rhodocollybia butyracea]
MTGRLGTANNGANWNRRQACGFHCLKSLPVLPNNSFRDYILRRVLHKTRTGEILVLPEYPAIVSRIAKVYKMSPGTGVFITGQAGIGKSMFLTYLLIILLSLTPNSEEDPPTGLRASLIFLYTKSEKLLFYGGGIYEPGDLINFHLGSLPKPKKTIQWQYWATCKKPTVIELPFWSRELLVQGLKYQQAGVMLNARLNHWVKKQRVIKHLGTHEDEGPEDEDILTVMAVMGAVNPKEMVETLGKDLKEKCLMLPIEHLDILEDVSSAQLTSENIVELLTEKLLHKATIMQFWLCAAGYLHLS